MRVRVGVLCLLSVALTGCAGSAAETLDEPGPATPAPSASASAGVGEEEKQALLAQADLLAEEFQGRALKVVGVRTRSSTGREITGWSDQSPDEVVWILAVSGDEYFCRFCSGPSDDGKHSRHLTLTVRAEQPADERLTFGMSNTPYDLSRFGEVQTLRDG